ncbi:MAG: BMP family protein [Blastocatellia bacterium]|nr:BMP family protein [Blastocatellia bacterium]
MKNIVSFHLQKLAQSVFRCHLRTVQPALTAIALMCLIACGGTPPAAPPSPTDSASKPGQGDFRVALLSPGPISDNGWNAAGYEGLQYIEGVVGAKISQQQVKSSPADREQAYRDYAAKGYNMVIGHGGEFMDQALTVGKEFPNTMFVVTAGDRSAPNVTSIVFELGQSSYLAGAIAGKLTKSGKLGAVGGMDIPASTRMLQAFRNGAKAVNPKAEVTITYVGNWEDAAAARQQTLALIDKGVDFLIHDCDAAAPGFFQAVKDRNVMAFGVQKDQSQLAPNNIFASVTSEIPQGFVELAKRVKAGTQKGEVLRLGVKDKAVSFQMNPNMKGKITQDLEGILNQLLGDIRDGKIDVYQEPK